MLRSFLIPFLLILLGGCSTPPSDARTNEIEQLRSDVESLKALNEHVLILEQELKTIKEKIGISVESGEPIVSATLLPNSSQIDDPFIGPKDAEVIMMAFSEYQCAPCRRFYWDVFPELRKEFLDSGKIKFVFRDFPLKTNTNARPAAQLADCAGEQGYYWQMFEALYNSPEEVDSGNFYEIGKQVSAASQEELHSCMEKTIYNKEIDADIADGLSLGAGGAPGFFVGKKNEDGTFKGVFIRGAQPYGVIRNEIMKLF